MKIKIPFLILLMLLWMGVNSAHAASGDTYSVLKTGLMIMNLDDATPMATVGVYAGYGLDKNISLEVDLNRSVGGGEYSQSNGIGQYEILTTSFYGVYRFSRSRGFFLKAKVGALYENVENNTPNGESNLAQDFGMSGGGGFGLSFSGFTIEGEVTGIDADIILTSLGFHYQF